MATAAQSGFQGLRAKARESRKKGRFLNYADPTIPVPGTGLRFTIFHSCAKTLAFFWIFPKNSWNRNVAAWRPREPGHAINYKGNVSADTLGLDTW